MISLKNKTHCELFFEDNEEEASKYPNPGRSLSYHCLKKKKSVFWTKEYHKLQQSWTYSLFSNSAPQSTPLGVCHEASYLCCVNKRHQAFLDFFPSCSLHVFPSLPHTVVHRPVLLHTTLPHHNTSYLCQTERWLSSSSSPGLQLTFLIAAVHSTAGTGSA